jgi:hypothetical protein
MKSLLVFTRNVSRTVIVVVNCPWNVVAAADFPMALLVCAQRSPVNAKIDCARLVVEQEETATATQTVEEDSYD